MFKAKYLLYLSLGLTTFCFAGFYLGIGIPALILSFIPPLAIKIINDIAHDEVNALFSKWANITIDKTKQFYNGAISIGKSVFHSINSTLAGFFNFQHKPSKESETLTSILNKTENSLNKIETTQKNIYDTISEINQSNTKIMASLQHNEMKCNTIEKNVGTIAAEKVSIQMRLDALEKVMDSIREKSPKDHPIHSVSLTKSKCTTYQPKKTRLNSIDVIIKLTDEVLSINKP